MQVKTLNRERLDAILRDCLRPRTFYRYELIETEWLMPRINTAALEGLADMHYESVTGDVTVTTTALGRARLKD